MESWIRTVFRKRRLEETVCQLLMKTRIDVLVDIFLLVAGITEKAQDSPHFLHSYMK